MRSSVDKSKKESQRGAAFAKGGKSKMFGKQSAGVDRPGNTGKDRSPDGRFAKGGPKVSVGGLARPARGGSTGT